MLGCWCTRIAERVACNEEGAQALSVTLHRARTADPDAEGRQRADVAVCSIAAEPQRLEVGTSTSGRECCGDSSLRPGEGHGLLLVFEPTDDLSQAWAHNPCGCDLPGCLGEIAWSSQWREVRGCEAPFGRYRHGAAEEMVAIMTMVHGHEQGRR